MTEPRRESAAHGAEASGPYAQRIAPRPSRTVWCCTCDAVPEIGPHNHLGDHPDHYIVEATGEFHVWRNPAAIGEEAALERAHWWNRGAAMERRRTEDALRVLFHVISTNKDFDSFRPNELTDDAIRIGHEFLIEQGWWPAPGRQEPGVPTIDLGEKDVRQ